MASSGIATMMTTTKTTTNTNTRLCGSNAAMNGVYSKTTTIASLNGSIASAGTKAMRCTPKILADFWQRYDTFIFDADGVLWKGAEPIEGAAETVSMLIAAGKRVLVLTNNATRGVDTWLEKCANFGYQGIGRENIVSSAVVCTHELLKMRESAEHAERAHLPVYLIGATGLEEMLNDAGISTFGSGPDPVENYTNDTYVLDMDMSRKPFAVVTSFDPHFNYVKIMKAVNYLKDPDTPFIATHEDMTYPGPNPDLIIPAAGTTSTIIRAFTGRKPIVMGKPHKATWNYIFEHFGGKIDPRRTLMTGDRCDTDIMFGNSNHLDTLMVLSGVTSFTDLRALEQQKPVAERGMIPKYYTDSIKDLLL